MKTDLAVVLRALLAFVVLALCAAGMVGLLRLDVYVDAHNLSEFSWVELTQEVLLFLLVLGYFALARHSRLWRPAATLVGGFFACLLIRELDAFLDVVFHGFWVVPALLVAGLALSVAWKERAATLRGLAMMVRSPFFGGLLCGLVTLLVFSRLMGMSSLWQMLLQDGYARMIKETVEETLELFGYMQIFVASAGIIGQALRVARHHNSLCAADERLTRF